MYECPEGLSKIWNGQTNLFLLSTYSLWRLFDFQHQPALSIGTWLELGLKTSLSGVIFNLDFVW